MIPKGPIPDLYSDMLRLAAVFSLAEVNDEIQNRIEKGMQIDQEEMSKLLKSRYDFHVKNQIELCKTLK